MNPSLKGLAVDTPNRLHTGIIRISETCSCADGRPEMVHLELGALIKYVDLKKDVLYTLTFDFSTDVQLTGGKKGKPDATLESAFFDTFTGDVSLVSSPEPSTFTLFGLGSLGYGWWRRRRVA
jgi:hypothetical protein